VPIPLYKLCLVTLDEKQVYFKAGGPVEDDLVEMLVSHLLREGTRVWRTEDHLRKGILKALHEFKAKSIQTL